MRKMSQDSADAIAAYENARRAGRSCPPHTWTKGTCTTCGDVMPYEPDSFWVPVPRLGELVPTPEPTA